MNGLRPHFVFAVTGTINDESNDSFETICAPRHPQTVSLRYRLFLKLQNAKKTVAFPSALQVLSTTKHRFGNVDLVLVSVSHRPFLKTCILPLGAYTSRKLSTSSRRPLRNRELVNKVFLKYPPSFVLHYFSMLLFPFTVSKEV